ncbi:hypothetical protein [Georgenia yuyongxinii]|uniref:DUF5668 domain-containing protein n=1 Tax=Georgenia yuyongxinii TaxID=2589797 RepID=A0A552WMS2_9MICO|nr:hypothetical protein [Georgenia yuyongxinii]TRW44095.1 hypothetical protein FJ693_15125 [Georgenia yuyongxinii]
MRLQTRETSSVPSGRPGQSAPVWGVLLLLVGVVLLLDTLDVFPATGLFWAAAFAAAGLVFLYAFVTVPTAWWSAIPGSALLGLAAVAAWPEVAPAGDEGLGAAVLLALTGAGFGAVYVRTPRRWWAIIPAGAGVTLGVLVALTAVLSGAALGVVLFAGLALTFLLVHLLAPVRRRRWALVVAGALGVLGVMAALEADASLDLVVYAWPAALIVAGAYLLWNASRSRRSH